MSKPTATTDAALEPLVVDGDGFAKLLSRSRRSFHRLKAKGMLPPPIRLGGRGGRPVWRIEEIRRWIEAGAPPGDDWAKLEAARRTRHAGRRSGADPGKERT